MIRKLLVDIQRNANFELLRVGGIVGDIEVLHEDLTENKVVKLIIFLRHDTQMTLRCLRDQVLVIEQEALGGYFVDAKIEQMMLNREREDQIRHVLLDL